MSSIISDLKFYRSTSSIKIRVGQVLLNGVIAEGIPAASSFRRDVFNVKSAREPVAGAGICCCIHNAMVVRYSRSWMYFS